MPELLVVGGGFAGVLGALSAAYEAVEREADVGITLVSRDPYLTIRPRLYERNPRALRVPLTASLSPLGIDFLEGTVTAVDARNQRVTVALDRHGVTCRAYERLLLAAGSELRAIPVEGLRDFGWNVDTYAAAVALEQHLQWILETPQAPGHGTFVIIGGGFTGIELATEIRERIASHSDVQTAERARIVLVEQADEISPDLGPNPRPWIEAALRRANVEVRLGTSVQQVTADWARLSDGETVATRTVISTAGMVANGLARLIPVERDALGRLPTDAYLRVRGVVNVFAAGDLAHAYAGDEHLALMSCQHAREMGRFAGCNAARDLIGLRPLPYRQHTYVTCLDLGRSGALFTRGWERRVELHGDDAKAKKREINTRKIYPPAGTREEILAALAPAHPRGARSD